MSKPAPKSASKPDVKRVAPVVDSEVTPARATYIVGDCPMLHDGVSYMPGNQIELTPEQARRSARHVTLMSADFQKNNLE